MKNGKTARIKKYVKRMGNAVSVLSILFILSALLRMDFDKDNIKDWRSFLIVCIVGVILKMVTVYLSASAWCLWLEFFSGRHCHRQEARIVYAKANIGKYLPGNVMHYVERNLFATKLELSQKQIAAASIVEVVSLVFAAFFIGVCLAFSKLQETVTAIILKIPFFQKRAYNKPILEYIHFWNLLLLGIGFVLAVIFILYFKKHRQKREKYFRQYDIRKLIKTFFLCFILYATVLTILGLILVLIYWYWIGRPTFSQTLTILASYTIAWVLGFVIPGAPGGIGVREMALTLLLSSVIGESTIATISLLHRFITILGDFAAYLLKNCGRLSFSDHPKKKKEFPAKQ